MNTVILILAGVIFVAVIVIAIKGNRNIDNFHNSMDRTFEQAQREVNEYINHLNMED